MRVVVLSLSASLLLVGCAARIDGSSEAAFQESIRDMKEPMDAKEQEEFEAALMAIAFADVKDLSDIMAIGRDTEAYMAKMTDTLDGMTAADVLAEAKRIGTAREVEERKQMAVELAELEEKKRASTDAETVLSAFAVERSRFSFLHGYIVEPQIELTVKNGTDAAVSRAYFHGTLATPGRSVPWVDEDFNYEIPGGLEPGESATWRLAPNMFGPWGEAPKDRTDMVLTVKVVGLDGADREPLTGPVFGAADAERMATLKQELGVE